VVIFTKFDALVLKSYNKLWNQQKNHKEAKSAMHELANEIFQDHYLPQVQATEVPPKTYICLAGDILYPCKVLKFSQILEMDKKENQCSELSERTMDILDNDVLVELFVSTQTNNLDLCIKNGIMWVVYCTDSQWFIWSILNLFRTAWKSSRHLLQVKLKC